MADTENTAGITSDELQNTAVITSDQLQDYLGIDYVDNMISANIIRAIRGADAYLKGAIGDNYPVDDDRSKELALIIAADLYDNRGLQAQAGGSVSANTRKLVDDMILQLKCELRRKGVK